MRLNSLLSISVLLVSQIFFAQNTFISTNHFLILHTQDYYSGIDGALSTEVRIDSRNQRVANKIETQTTLTSSRNEKKTDTSFIAYNQKGMITTVNNERVQLSITYENDTLIKHYHQVTKKRTIEAFYTYDSLSKQITALKETKNDKPHFELERHYNDKGKIVYEKKKGGKKLTNTYEMKYTYSDDNKLSKIEYYKNNKLINVWNYDCSEKGELEKDVKKSDVTQSSTCSWNEENNDNSYITYTRFIKDKKTYLTKAYYTADSVLHRQEHYVKETQLTNSLETTPFTSLRKYYKKNGKVNSSTLTVLNEDKTVKYVIRTYFNFLSTYQYQSENTYNAQQLLTAKKTTIKGKEAPKTTFSYTFYQ
jgi:hypothetical protein